MCLVPYGYINDPTNAETDLIGNGDAGRFVTFSMHVQMLDQSLLTIWSILGHHAI
jgi:hypothetical protein